jgi:EAL domain-containing protein (putative c-di-GMP-specific phosphodiesterase class I)
MLVLELTESILMHEEDLVMHAIDELRAIGVRLSIDDFGTGYSSMTYLKRFEVDRLKIDKSFVMTMSKSEEDKSIVRYVIDLAASLNITSIAEGVENEETLSMLMDMGCDQAQGYFFSKPVPPAEIEAYFN